MEQALAELRSEETRTRLLGIRRLALAGGAEAAAVLVPLLDDPDEEVACRAALTLGELDAPEALAVLLEHLRSNRSPGVRGGCALALESLGEACPLEPLAAALHDPDETVAATAASVLGRRGDAAAVEPLLSLLDDPRWDVRYHVCQALAGLRVREPGLARALEELLRAPEQLRRFQSMDWVHDALEWLRAPPPAGLSGPAPPEDAQALAKAELDLQDADPDCRRRAALRLHHLGGPDAAAALNAALDDPAPAVRAAAALALGTWEDHRALPGLTRRLLHDESPHVRRLCAAFLHRFPAAEVIEPLIRALRDPDWGVRLAAGVDLGLLGDPRAIPALLEALDDPVWNNRANACWALVRLRAADPRLIAALERLSRDPEAAEWDLQTEETNLMMASCPPEDGEPAPEPGPKIHELLAMARALAGSGSSPGGNA